MSSPRSMTKREFAVDVVRRIRAAGYESLWAGGCVRDQLLQLDPKDYDVATDAPPAIIRQIFGHSRTISIGAAFGVITVIGPKSAGNVEVATFRQDAQYSDGRHPDAVTFSTAECDAQRRDFTINGLFYDPLTNSVIDYVNGRADLEARILRAIGNPDQRFAEDKLRMLRAVRFTITYDFELEHETLIAIQRHAQELTAVSVERIADELRRMLAAPRRAQAIRLLQESGLLMVILPEASHFFKGGSANLSANLKDDQFPSWQRTRNTLHALSDIRTRPSQAQGRATQDPSFSMVLAALLRELYAIDPAIVNTIGQRWKLSLWETNGTGWLLANEATIRSASQVPWPKLQRLLIDERIDELLGFAESIVRSTGGSLDEIDFCSARLAWSSDVLNPAPLITGDDLKQAGMVPGPGFRAILEAVRDAQLEKRIVNRDEALRFAWEQAK